MATMVVACTFSTARFSPSVGPAKGTCPILRSRWRKSGPGSSSGRNTGRGIQDEHPTAVGGKADSSRTLRIVSAEPVRHRFTVEDYYQMSESGLFDRDKRVELLDGE